MSVDASRESRRAKRIVGMPACPQMWTNGVQRQDEQHSNLPELRSEASV